MKVDQNTFATFPKFSKLTLNDRELWEELIADYPPISDISFVSLMIWWNTLNSFRVAQLNGNLILSYWIPGDEKNSGLCVVGTHAIDETVCTIFDHLKEKGEEPRLVHVPEFVLQHIKYPEMYVCKNERNYDECILNVNRFCYLENLNTIFRRRVKRLLCNEQNIKVNSLDLAQKHNQRLLSDLYCDWKDKSVINSLNKCAEEGFFQLINSANKLGVENACLYVSGELHAFILYNLHPIRDYALINFAKFSYELPYIFEFAVYKFAEWFRELGVKHVNIDMDIGDLTYRSIQLALGPSQFFRKYTITPHE